MALPPISRSRWIEVAVLAPSTFVMVSALPFGIAVTFFALLVGLLVPGSSFSNWARNARPLLALLAMMLAAAAGMIALWLSVWRGEQWVCSRGRRKALISAGLIAGVAAIAYWFWLQGAPRNPGSAKALLLWIAILAAPFILAGKHIFFLFRTKA